MSRQPDPARRERQYDLIGRELHPRGGLVTPGRSLYERWCDAPGSDREHYFLLMNVADQEHWEKLAAEIEAQSLRCFAAGRTQGHTEGARDMEQRYVG